MRKNFRLMEGGQGFMISLGMQSTQKCSELQRFTNGKNESTIMFAIKFRNSRVTVFNDSGKNSLPSKFTYRGIQLICPLNSVHYSAFENMIILPGLLNYTVLGSLVHEQITVQSRGTPY